MAGKRASVSVGGVDINLKEKGLGGAVKIVVKTFLEQKHYQDLHKHLSEEWSHCHSLTAAVRLMEAHGVHVSPQEEQKLAELPEDRMIDALVMRMPEQSREQFEHFFLQLSLIASTTTRLRAALETGDEQGVEEVMDSAENVGILQFILKMAVAQAGQEVKTHEADHIAWLAATGDRMAPLLQSQANAITCKIALEDAKKMLDHHQVTANDKTKKVLMSLAGGSAELLKASVFSVWADYVETLKKEHEIRKEYAEEIDLCEKRLQDYIVAQSKIMTNMINRKHSEAAGGLIGACLQAFVDELGDKGDRLKKEEEMKILEGKMSNFSAEQSAKNKKVMSRLNAGSDQGLLTLCLSAWVQFIAEYNKNRAFEDAVKAEEKKIKEFMDSHTQHAKGVLNNMAAGTDSGLIQTVFMEWVEIYKEMKQAMEFEDMMSQGRGRMDEFSSRNKGSAGTAMDRSAAAAENSTYIVIFSYWKREMKVERMRRWCRDKDKKKKNQLVGVKGLFKNFANELEQGLKDGTPRLEPGQGAPSREASQSPSKKKNASPSPKVADDEYGPA